MIVGIVKGGLGNQLFQYAATRKLAHLHRVPFQLNLSEIIQDGNRAFRLGEFIELEPEMVSNEPLPKRTLARKVLDLFNPWYRQFYIVEKEGNSLPYFHKFPSHCIIDGYWQQQEFITVEEMRNLFGQNEYHPEHRVAVHFRGGDYINNSRTSEYHGNLTQAYYEKAFEKMQFQYPNVKFNLFSDQPERFAFPFLTKYETEWVDEKDEVVAFQRLLKYQSFIIANSSFSWWPAFLNDLQKGKVIAPKRWFNAKELHHYSPVLTHWMQL